MDHSYFLSIVGDVEAASEFVAFCNNNIEQYANDLCEEFFMPTIKIKGHESDEQFKDRAWFDIMNFKQKARNFAECQINL